MLFNPLAQRLSSNGQFNRKFPKFRGSHIKTSVTKGNKRRAQWQRFSCEL